MTFSHRIDSPVGPMILRSDGKCLTAASFSAGYSPGTTPGAVPDAGPAPAFEPVPSETNGNVPDVLRTAGIQLSEYFSGGRTAFDLSLAPAGTDFQRRVWAELRRVPWGERISYGELARRIDAPDAVRAVGAANGKNPIAIIIPCHRIIGADGSLTGYAGGIHRKRRLLDLESGAPTLFD